MSRQPTPAYRTGTAAAIVHAGLILLLCLSAHAGTILKREGFAGISGTRVVLMPCRVEEFEITAGGPQARADWSATAVQTLQETLSGALQSRGLTVSVYREPDDPEQRSVHQQIIKVHTLVVQTIQRYRLTPGQELPSKRGRFDWGLGSAVRPLRPEGETAAYALFVDFVEGHSSGGRAALNVVGAVLGGRIIYGRQTGVASLVDLATGDVVWFSRRLVDGSGDLRTPEGARDAVKELLEALTR